MKRLISILSVFVLSSIFTLTNISTPVYAQESNEDTDVTDTLETNEVEETMDTLDVNEIEESNEDEIVQANEVEQTNEIPPFDEYKPFVQVQDGDNTVWAFHPAYIEKYGPTTVEDKTVESYFVIIQKGDRYYAVLHPRFDSIPPYVQFEYSYYEYPRPIVFSTHYYKVIYERDDTLEIGSQYIKTSGKTGYSGSIGKVQSVWTRCVLIYRPATDEIVVVGTKPTETIEYIPYKTIYKNDPTLESGCDQNHSSRESRFHSDNNDLFH